MMYECSTSELLVRHEYKAHSALNQYVNSIIKHHFEKEDKNLRKEQGKVVVCNPYAIFRGHQNNIRIILYNANKAYTWTLYCAVL